ncbi:MAG: hypothetical protein ABW023_15140 [Sphingomonas sp.]
MQGKGIGERVKSLWRLYREPRPKVRRMISVWRNLFVIRSFRALLLPIGFHIAAAILSWLWLARGETGPLIGLSISCLVLMHESQQPGRPSYVDIPGGWRAAIEYILQGGRFRYDRAGRRWSPISDYWQLDAVRIEPRGKELRLYSTKGVLEDLVFLARNFSVDGMPDVDAMRAHDERISREKSGRRIRVTA